MLLVHIRQEWRGFCAEFSGDGSAASVDSLVYGAVGDVEVKAVLLGEIIVGAGPSVFSLDYAGQVECFLLLMTGDAVFVEHRLDETNVVEGI